MPSPFFRTRIPKPIETQLQIYVFERNKRCERILIGGLAFSGLLLVASLACFFSNTEVGQGNSPRVSAGAVLFFFSLIIGTISAILFGKQQSSSVSTAEEITITQIQNTLGYLSYDDFQAVIKLLYQQARLAPQDAEQESLPDLSEDALTTLGRNLYYEIRSAVYPTETSPLLRL